MASWGNKYRRDYNAGDVVEVTKIAWWPVWCDDDRRYWLEKVTTVYRVIDKEELEMEGFKGGDVPHPMRASSYVRKYVWDVIFTMPASYSKGSE